MALERVNYFNGQRLTAADFQVDADYELQVRRMLMRGLFSAGVVNGLEVTKSAARQVSVAPGLALDVLGREVFLAGPRTVQVPNAQPPPGKPGYYLVIRYAEQTAAPGSNACGPGGGPTRIVEDPVLAFTADYPNPALCAPGNDPLQCGVVLAMVALDSSCQVATVAWDFRQYAIPAHLSRVRSFALEGEKDIDPSNPKVLYFDVGGGPPNAVLLTIRGDRFSTLYYTELGSHKHSLDLGGTGGHTHSVPASGGMTSGGMTLTQQAASQNPPDLAAGTSHHHQIRASASDANYLPGTSSDGITTGAGVGATRVLDQTARGHPFIEDTDLDHTHQVPQQTTGPPSGTSAAGDTAATGAPDEPARSGSSASPVSSYGYLDHLKVELDGMDITPQLLGRLNWTELGKGSSGDPINSTQGTGPIELLRLPMVPLLGSGSHRLKFSVASGGGKVMWNLAVE